MLLDEVVTMLDPQPGSRIFDGTVGLGGHAEALLAHTHGKAELIGFDSDTQALAVAQERLAKFGNKVRLMQANFDDVDRVFEEQGIESKVNTMLLDLGVSSLELEGSGRGFSFLREDEPLDMRFDARGPARQAPTSFDLRSKSGRSYGEAGGNGPTAASLLNSADLEHVADIFRRYGEEPHARALAHAVIRRRKEHPFSSVQDLVSLAMAQAAHHGSHSRQRMHPATRIFQALRIAVNDELGCLERALPKLLALLVPGGRIAVISFHSLEDRIVKNFFRQEATDCLCPSSFPVCRCGHKAQLTILTKHVIVPTDQEQTENPRSRSAKLRVAEKL